MLYRRFNIRAVLFAIALSTLPLLLGGCAGFYFSSAGNPPDPPPAYELARWPYREYWTGIVFNGAKIGFSHFSIAPSEEVPGEYVIRSEAVLRIRFLGIDKRVHLKSTDRVRGDLRLVRFAYDHDLDGHRMRQTGTVVGNRLAVELERPSSGRITRREHALEEPLYPSAAILLFPVMEGLAPGRRYVYAVYDGETRAVSPVEQEILTYERSELFPGTAFKMETRCQGQRVTTWLDAGGKPQLEISMGGVILSTLETETEAKRYLAQAAIDKADHLLDFSLIPIDRPIPDPEGLVEMVIVLSGMGDHGPPSDDRQFCIEAGSEGSFRCTVAKNSPAQADRSESPGNIATYLAPSYRIPSDHPKIRETAARIAAPEMDRLSTIQQVLSWMEGHIRKQAVDVFTAMDVLEGGRAECQGHALLFAALSRALGIPTKVVNGIVYTAEHGGFLYHTWVECRVGGSWVAVDPTFGQMPADATHIKLVEGENTSDLLPLMDVIGRISARIIHTEP